MANFATGDLVRLKSGGPTMTVTRVVGDPTGNPQMDNLLQNQGLKEGDVICTWFNTDDEKQDSGFAAEALTRVDADG